MGKQSANPSKCCRKSSFETSISTFGGGFDNIGLSERSRLLGKLAGGGIFIDHDMHVENPAEVMLLWIHCIQYRGWSTFLPVGFGTKYYAAKRSGG